MSTSRTWWTTDDAGYLHIHIVGLMARAGVPDTPANRRRVRDALVQVMDRLRLEVQVVIDGGCQHGAD